MEHALEQHVTELALEVVEVAAIDRVQRFVGFFEQEGPQRSRRLFAIPRTAVRRSKRRHDPDESCERARGSRRSSCRCVRAGGRSFVCSRGRSRAAMLHSSVVRVLFLGTGTSHGVPMIGCDCDVCRSPDPRDKRLRPSIFMEFDDGLRVLVDTTPDLRAQALRADIRQVDAILFTHSHADHLMGLDEVRRYNMLRRAPMPIYGDANDPARAAPDVCVHVRVQRAEGRRRSRPAPLSDRRPVLPGPSGSAAGADPSRPVGHPGLPRRAVCVSHRLQRHSGLVAGTAAGTRLPGARCAAASTASHALHAGRSRGDGHAHRRHTDATSRTSRTSSGMQARARSCRPGWRWRTTASKSRFSDAGRVLSGSSAAEVARARHCARELRRVASRPSATGGGGLRPRGRARGHWAWPWSSIRIRRRCFGPTKRRRC